MDAKNLRRPCYSLKQVVLASVATKVIDAIYVVARLQGSAIVWHAIYSDVQCLTYSSMRPIRMNSVNQPIRLRRSRDIPRTVFGAHE
jgi:hypothetical protein